MIDSDPLARWDDMKVHGPYARTLTRWTQGAFHFSAKLVPHNFV